MYEIPKPALLDPDRVDRDDREDVSLEDHRSRAQLLDKALVESCSYADQLWEQLNRVRAYLLGSLPPDPRKPGAHTTAAASPTGPDDEEGWQRWIDAFATTTSALCGAHGDSGFGLSRAREEAQLRRTAPELRLLAEHPLPEPTTDEPSAGADTDPPTVASDRPAERTGARWSPVKVAGLTALVVLAARGLRTPGPAR